jgi:hypothetical protein
MNYTDDKYNRAKSDMLGEFNKALLEAEELRKAETVARERPEERPESAGATPTGAIPTGGQP